MSNEPYKYFNGSAFNTLTNSIKADIVIFSNNLTVEYANENFKERFDDDCIGQKLDDILNLSSNFYSFLKNKIPSDFEETINEDIYSQFEDRWDNINLSKVNNTDGSISYIIILTDISEQKKGENNITQLKEWQTFQSKMMEESRQQLENALKNLLETKETTKTISDTALDAIIMLNNDAIITFWNKAAEKVFGYKENEIVGKPLHDILTPERFHKDFLRGFKKFKSTGKGKLIGKTSEITAIHKDGHEFDLELSISAMKIDGKWHAVGMAKDISERKKAERDIKEINQELLKHRKRLTRSNTELKKSNKEIEFNNYRLEVLLKLNEMSKKNIKEIADFAIDASLKLTNSKMGYFTTLNEYETVLTMVAWTKSAWLECTIVDKPLIYIVEETGLWGEAVRQRKPIITNDYQSDNPLKKGYPEGHVDIINHMNIPVFDGDKIVAVAGVGNKDSDYNESDVNHLTLLMQGVWKLIQRKRADEEIAAKNIELNASKKELEIALNKLEFSYSKLFENITDCVAIYDVKNDGKDFIFKDLNKAAEIAEKVKKEDIIGKNVVDVFPGVIKFGLYKVFQEVWQTGEPGYLDITFYKDDRISGWKKNSVYKLPSGEIVALYQDITEQKLTEEQLKLSQFCLDNSTIQTFWVIPDGSILYANKEACKSLGYTEDEMLSLKVVDFDYLYNEEMWNNHWKELEEKGSITLETIHQSKNGILKNIKISASYLEYQGQKINFAYGIDITDEKKAEEHLKLTQFSIDNAAIQTFWIKEDGSIIYVNKETCNVLEYSEKEILSKKFIELLPLYKEDKWINLWNELEKKEFLKLETKINTKSGNIKNIHLTCNYTNYKKDKFCFAFAIDLTERKKLEQQLKSTHFSIDSAAIQTLWIEPDGSIVFANKYAYKTLGYTEEELLSLNIKDIDVSFTEDLWNEHWKKIEEKQLVSAKTTHKRKDGSHKNVLTNSNYIVYKEKKYCFVFVYDILFITK